MSDDIPEEFTEKRKQDIQALFSRLVATIAQEPSKVFVKTSHEENDFIMTIIVGKLDFESFELDNGRILRALEHLLFSVAGRWKWDAILEVEAVPATPIS